MSSPLRLFCQFLKGEFFWYECNESSVKSKRKNEKTVKKALSDPPCGICSADGSDSDPETMPHYDQA